MQEPKDLPRTVRAESVLAAFASMPLMRQTVFQSPKFLDGKIEKEVCDHLLVHRGEAIVIQMKAQEEPRDELTTRKWAAKQFPKALSQAIGARRTLRERTTWCEHDDYGRVDFAPGAIKLRHILVLLESEFEVLLEAPEPSLLARASKERVTVMSIQDFLCLLRHQRTWRDLVKYLEARHDCLQSPDNLTIGNELALVGYYTAMRDSFRGCRGIADARIVHAKGEHVEPGSAFRDKERLLASILESLMGQLPTMKKTTMPPELQHLEARFAPIEQAQIELRDELCDLTIQERAALGEQIGVISTRFIETKPDAPLYGAVRFNRHPDHLFMVVLGSSADQESLAVEAMDLTISGCVHYERTVGIALVLNQVGEFQTFNIAKIENVQWDAEMAEAGREHFGHVHPRSVTVAR